MKANKFTQELKNYSKIYKEFSDFMLKKDNIELNYISFRVIKYEGRFKQFLRNEGYEVNIASYKKTKYVWAFYKMNQEPSLMNGYKKSYKKALQIATLMAFEYLEKSKFWNTD